MTEAEIRKQFKNEGLNVYDYDNQPGEVYEPHRHRGRVSFYVTAGYIDVNMNGKEERVITGKRFNVPPATVHSAIVGPEGCSFIVGEEIKGDA